MRAAIRRLLTLAVLSAMGARAQPVVVAVATPSPGVATVTAKTHTLAAAEDQTCALQEGQLVCWGGYRVKLEDPRAECGSPSPRGEVEGGAGPKPQVVGGLGRVRSVAVGGEHVCAANEQGQVWCWGRNHALQLPDFDTSGASVVVRQPLLQPSLAGLSRLAAGGGTTCGLRAAGVRCWGQDEYGQTGHVPGPLVDLALEGVVEVLVGPLHACALRRDGSLVCWGQGVFGQLGFTPVAGATAAEPTLSALRGVSAAANGVATCAIESGGTVRCAGELPFDGNPRDGTPWKVAGIGDARALALGESHACVALADGAVRCWGENRHGQLGDGTTTAATAPVAVAGLTGVVELTAGRAHTCARTGRGQVWCWGDNSLGQLGDGTAHERLAPVPVKLP